MEILAIVHHFMTDAQAQVKFHRHVSRIDNLDRGHREVLDNINELYELFPDKKDLHPDELKAFLKKKYPSRDTSYLGDIIDSSMTQPIGPEVTQSLIEAVIERHMAAKLMAVCAPIVSNQKTGGLVETDDIMHEYRELCALANRPDQLQDCDMSFQEAIEFRATDSGIKWPVDILNKCIGGVSPSLGLIMARPDVGKTSFILNCLAYYALQLKGTDHQLLYCGNEEGIVGLKARMGVSLLGCQTEWAEQNPREFDRQVQRKNGNCIRFHGGVRSTRDVEQLIKRYNPLVTVADQIGKFSIPGNKLEGAACLAAVYGWFREKSQELQTMVMGVAQADFKGSNKQWLSMDNINASKTDVPGELDWGIGIGFLDEPGMEFVRFLNVFKNKLKYGRKGRDDVTFTPETCRYSD